MPYSPVRDGASPIPVPPPVTEGVIAAPRPRRPGKSPLSRMSASSSSTSSTTVARPSPSSTPSTERTRMDPRKDSSSGGDSRTPLGWLFKKRMKEQSNEQESASSNSVDINVESPVRFQQSSTFRLTDPDATSLNQVARSTAIMFLLSTPRNLHCSARITDSLSWPENRPHRHPKRQGASHLCPNSLT